ncbi:MAG: DHHA1 domain-containing protein, partial [Pseudomonadota bacterium]
RVIESQMRDSADLVVQKLTATGKPLPAALSLHHPDWHPGVVGILAGRIKDRHHRPTVAFAAADHGKLVGSARSVPDLHIRDTIAAIAHANPDLIERFGGHAMAAGLTISAARLGTFETLFAEVCAEHLGDKADVKTVMSDGTLSAEDFSLELARLLRFAAPWGQAFAEPQFDGEFTVRRSRVVGERHLQMELQGAQGGSGISAIAFGQSTLHGATQVRLVYRLKINHWRGRDSLQLNVLHTEVIA